jgi:putative protease
LLKKKIVLLEKIGVTLHFTETADGFQLRAIDDGHESVATGN